LLLILNVEFFAIIFLIVYVGAIAVLFLFMVMTLDIKNPNVSQKFRDFFAYKIWIIILILMQMLIFLNEDVILLVSNNNLSDYTFLNTYINYAKILKNESHLEIIGKALFKEYIIPFLLSGFILFIAMIGAIVVTVEESMFKNIKQQDSVNQAYRLNEKSTFNFKTFVQKNK